MIRVSNLVDPCDIFGNEIVHPVFMTAASIATHWKRQNGATRFGWLPFMLATLFFGRVWTCSTRNLMQTMIRRRECHKKHVCGRATSKFWSRFWSIEMVILPLQLVRKAAVDQMYSEYLLPERKCPWYFRKLWRKISQLFSSGPRASISSDLAIVDVFTTLLER